MMYASGLQTLPLGALRILSTLLLIVVVGGEVLATPRVQQYMVPGTLL